MSKSKPFETIATRFKISAESAKYFLGHVQKSFKTEKPQQQMIVDFMHGKKYKSLPEPHAVATAMFESGTWAYTLKTPPPVLVDEEDLYF